MSKDKVSNAVVSRLPVYYRYLSTLEKAGYVRISSQQLGEKMGLTASQIRQDINCFGGFGQQGYGYNVSGLRMRVGEILGMTQTYRMVIVGAGNIGRALSHYKVFARMGFEVGALFDVDERLIGKNEGGKEVLHVERLPEYMMQYPVDVGIVAVPDVAAQGACDMLVAGGVRAIWNFAPIDLTVPDHVVLRSVHLLDALLVLSYYMANQNQRGSMSMPGLHGLPELMPDASNQAERVKKAGRDDAKPRG